MAAILGQRDLFGRYDVTGWDTGLVRVVVADKSAVDTLIKQLHYSRSVVWSSSVHLLVQAGETVVGAMQFGPAMNPQSGGGIVRGSSTDTWLELNRMAFTEDRPAQCGSGALSAALKLLRQIRPRVEWVQSFADERCGKFGAVYQAASFLYCGEHVSSFFELDGEWFHKSAWGRAAVDKRGWGCGPKLEHFNRQRHRATAVSFRQFRYIKCLTKHARRNLLLRVQPYPKPEHG